MDARRVSLIGLLILLVAFLATGTPDSHASPFLGVCATPTIDDIQPLWILPNSNVTIRGSGFTQSMTLYMNYILINPPDSVLLAGSNPKPYTMALDTIYWQREWSGGAPYYLFFWFTCGGSSGSMYYYISSTEVVCTLSSADPYLPTLTAKAIFAIGTIDPLTPNRMEKGSLTSTSLDTTWRRISGFIADISPAWHHLGVGFYAPALNSLQVSPRAGGILTGGLSASVSVTLTGGYGQSSFDPAYPIKVREPGTANPPILHECAQFLWTAPDAFRCDIVEPNVIGQWRFVANMSNGYELTGPDLFTTTYTVCQGNTHAHAAERRNVVQMQSTVLSPPSSRALCVCP
jgi:hypothetical protein